MRMLRAILLIVLLAPVGTVAVSAQNRGILTVSGRVTINSKKEKLLRKRFYLFRGGFTANKALMDRLASTSVLSRDCFYCKMNASPGYIKWLKDNDCESPYCREITKEDRDKVPEFQAAYDKAEKQYSGKPKLAQKWLTTFLAPDLKDGFYRQRKASIDTILGSIKPLQSSMTDTVSIQAVFIDIPLEKKVVDPKTGKESYSETFLVSNLVPIEIGGKGYLWACEVEIGSPPKVTTVSLPAADTAKCKLIPQKAADCDSSSCKQP